VAGAAGWRAPAGKTLFIAYSVLHLDYVGWWGIAGRITILRGVQVFLKIVTVGLNFSYPRPAMKSVGPGWTRFRQARNATKGTHLHQIRVTILKAAKTPGKKRGTLKRKC
jgi:hypothetical protein